MEEGGRGGREPRVAIIQAVQTPLGFFVLVVLVVEVLLGVVAAMSPGIDRTLLIVAMVVLIFLLVLIVTVLAIKWPMALNPRHGSFRDQGSTLNLRVALEFEGLAEQSAIQLDRRATYIIENAFNPERSDVREVLLHEAPGGIGWLCPIPLEARPSDMITFRFSAMDGGHWESTVLPDMLWPKAQAKRVESELGSHGE